MQANPEILGLAFGIFLIGATLTAVVFALFVTFIPALVAFHRGHPNRVAILVLVLFLGWTGLGWIAAMVWAFTSPPR